MPSSSIHLSLAFGGLALLALALLAHLDGPSRLDETSAEPGAREAASSEMVTAPQIELIAEVLEVEIRPPGSHLPDEARVEIGKILTSNTGSGMGPEKAADSQEIVRGSSLELKALYGLKALTIEYVPVSHSASRPASENPMATDSTRMPDASRVSGNPILTILTSLVDEIIQVHLPGLRAGDRFRAKISYFGAGQGSLGIYEVLAAGPPSQPE